MSSVSDTDARIFGGLANPSKTRLSDLEADRRDGSLLDRPRPSSRGSSSHCSQVPEEEEPDYDEYGGVDRYNDDRASEHSDTRSRKSDRSTKRDEEQPEDRYDERDEYETRAGIEEDDQRTEVASHVSSQITSVYETPAPPRGNGVFNQFVRSSARPPSTIHNSTQYENAGRLAMQEKQNVLMDIERLKTQGVRFSKEWSLDDSLDDMNYEVRRHMLHIEEQNNLATMRDGMRMICTGVEMLNGRMKILDLDGWTTEVCSDMSKYDAALGKLHRKYWRRSYSSSPEMELATSVLMSMGMYHFKRKITSRMFPPPPQHPVSESSSKPFSRSNRRGRRQVSPTRSDTSSEGMPP